MRRIMLLTLGLLALLLLAGAAFELRSGLAGTPGGEGGMRLLRSPLALLHPGEKAEPSQPLLKSLKASFNRTFVREDRYLLVLRGLGVTLAITALAGAAGLLLGLLLCLCLMRGPVWLRRLTGLYIRLFQGTPMVVTLMVFYYVIFGSASVSAFLVAVLAFAMNFSAYTAESLCSAIRSVDRGQREAALALGYSEGGAFLRFVLPQAMLYFLPVFTGQFVSLLKSTAIVGYVAVQDLTKMGDIIRSHTYEAFFPLASVAAIYFAIFLLVSGLLARLQRRLAPDRARRRVKGVSLPASGAGRD